MSMEVKVTTQDVGAELDASLARALLAAGAEVLAASDVLAPKEPDPRHGVHGVDTGVVQVDATGNSYDLHVGYEAFWMRLQHEHTEWNHPTGGEAEFLLKAAVAGEGAFWEKVAASVREGLSG